MAWISVHEEIVGKKLRKLAKSLGCSQAEAIGILNVLWLWGLNNAEQSGEITDASRVDVADAIPAGMVSEGLEPIRIIDTLIETQWIDEIDGTLYLHDWDHWQEQWYKSLSRRAYDAEQKRKKRAKEREEKSGAAAPVKGPPPAGPAVVDEGLAAVMDAYLNKVNPTASPTSLEILKNYTASLTAEVVLRAIDKALDEKKTAFSYIRGILQNYQKDGVKCLADAMEHDARWEAKKDGAVQSAGGTDEKSAGWDLSGATRL